MSQVIPGQALLVSDYEPVEQGLRKFITELVFRPLAQIWKEEVGRRLVYENSADSDRTSLIKALRAGRMQYSLDARGIGIFSGETSAVIGRALRALGAKWDSQRRVYRTFESEKVPYEVVAASAAHTRACETAHQRMDRFLAGVQGQLDQYVSRMDPATLRADQMVADVTREFQTGVQRVGIPFVKPDAAARAAMSSAYTHNAQLWIRKWVAEDIVRLRHQVEANVRSGARASTLAARISQRYVVAQSKARFLARNESSNFMSEYHKEQYLGAGCPRYVWKTAKDCDVRLGHQQLEGRVFNWNEGAPAKYMSCNRNCNPGQDYLCRCSSAALVDTVYNARFKIGDKYVKEK
jgi:SPP1 gp7 family putative phage head morphogenesis protein